MSSRNAYLTAAEREAAPVLHEALKAGRVTVLAGERDPAAVPDLAARSSRPSPSAELDYVALVDPATLEPGRGRPLSRLLTAARLGIPRLLDNVALIVPG